MEIWTKLRPVIQILVKTSNYNSLWIIFLNCGFLQFNPLNYNETYFELDSEEATHCDHCHLLCCVYIKGHVEMVDTKDQSNAIVYGMFVNTVGTGVCGSYTTLYTEYYEVWKLYSTLYKMALTPPRGKANVDLLCLQSCGFSCSPVSPRRQLC